MQRLFIIAPRRLVWVEVVWIIFRQTQKDSMFWVLTQWTLMPQQEYISLTGGQAVDHSSTLKTLLKKATNWN